MRRFFLGLAVTGLLCWAASGCGGETPKVQNTSGINLKPLPNPDSPGGAKGGQKSSSGPGSQ